MKQERKYLSVTVKQKNGHTFNNPLKLSEVHLLSKMAKENDQLTVVYSECSAEQYKYMFG